MRDFNFEGANTGAADISGQRAVVVEDIPAASVLNDNSSNDFVRDEAIVEDTSAMRPFHADEDDEETSNLPKYLGAAAVVAILAVGGGIYAYESSTSNQAPKTVAMKSTPAPAKVASNPPVAPTPPAALPENTMPATPAPAPVKSASATPAPVVAAPEQQASAAPSKPGVGIGPTDNAAINAPMTFTADNAPPPQQAGSSSQVAQTAPAPQQIGANPAPAEQTAANPAPANQSAANPAPADQTAAMQQPVTAPNVGNTAQPTASVAQLPQRQVQPAIQPAP